MAWRPFGGTKVLSGLRTWQDGRIVRRVLRDRKLRDPAPVSERSSRTLRGKGAPKGLRPRGRQERLRTLPFRRQPSGGRQSAPVPYIVPRGAIRWHNPSGECIGMVARTLSGAQAAISSLHGTGIFGRTPPGPTLRRWNRWSHPASAGYPTEDHTRSSKIRFADLGLRDGRRVRETASAASCGWLGPPDAPASVEASTGLRASAR
jgi:hypothetical protein